MTRAQRNDPCPCGSGKKYKACCQERDRATDRTLRLVGADAGAAGGDLPWGPAAREAECWEADVVPLQIAIREDRDATPALVMVCAGEFIVHCEMVARRPVGPADRAHAIADAVSQAGRGLGVLPETLHVREEEVAEALAEELRPRGISVRAAPLPTLDEAAESTIGHLAGDPVAAHMVRLESWGETEASPAEIEELHAAAAAFYRAEPWSDLENGDMVELRLPGGETFVASVLGAGGEEFGLNLYSTPEDLAAILEDENEPEVEELIARMVGWQLVVDFERRGELPRRMRREVADAGWEPAGPQLYPCLWGIRLPGHRIAAHHVRLMTTVLRAVTRRVAADRGEGPPPADDGVEVEIHYERPQSPFPPLAAAHPVTAEGPNADPRAALGLLDADVDIDALLASEAERVGRFERWLAAQPLAKAVRRRHLRNARELAEYLALQLVTTPGCTEFDLRHYLYAWLPRRIRFPRDVGRAIPQSLRAWFDWLAEHEGISCPWAAGVLNEILAMLAQARLDADAEWWNEPGWPGAFWLDASLRGFVPDHELPGTDGWPAMMSGDVAVARETLSRQWLLWYDELARGGLTELDLLWEALARRQHAWEKEPLAGLGGRTPREVVREQEEALRANGDEDDGGHDEAELYDLSGPGEPDAGTPRDG